MGWIKTVPEISLDCLWSHTGELPLRHLITNLDDLTLSNNKWSGYFGKMLDLATDLDIDPEIPKVLSGPQLITLSD